MFVIICDLHACHHSLRRTFIRVGNAAAGLRGGEWDGTLWDAMGRNKKSRPTYPMETRRFPLLPCLFGNRPVIVSSTKKLSSAAESVSYAQSGNVGTMHLPWPAGLGSGHSIRDFLDSGNPVLAESVSSPAEDPTKAPLDSGFCQSDSCGLWSAFALCQQAVTLVSKTRLHSLQTVLVIAAAGL